MVGTSFSHRKAKIRLNAGAEVPRATAFVRSIRFKPSYQKNFEIHEINIPFMTIGQIFSLISEKDFINVASNKKLINNKIIPPTKALKKITVVGETSLSALFAKIFPNGKNNPAPVIKISPRLKLNFPL